MAKRKSLDKWIHEAITDSDKDTTLTQITLYHMRGMQPIEIHTWKVRPGADPKQVAEMFQDKANAYAQDLEGNQMFNLMAFYGKSTPEAQMPFAVRVEADVHNSGLSTEAPTDQGERQQRMRWTEMQLGQVYRRQQVMDEHSIRMIERQSQMIDSLMAERFTAANMIVEMMTRQMDNNHRLEMERLQYQRQSEERQKLLQLAPALVNSLTGKEVFPQTAADSALIDTIATSLDENHLAKLMELDLPPALMGPLAERVLKARQKKEQEEAARRALPSYKGDPADDVKGGAE